MKTVFTTGEAAKICKVSQQTIIRCFDSGQLKGFRVPGSRFRRIPREQLYLFIDEYDNFSNQLLTAREDAVYRALTSKDSFLRTFYKVIKAGVGKGRVARVFVTGVLPVTMDDLTSGFNIGQESVACGRA